jgi:hypothetical protein
MENIELIEIYLESGSTDLKSALERILSGKT